MSHHRTTDSNSIRPRRRCPSAATTTTLLLLLALPPRAAIFVRATFSIVAADARTRRVGGAGASCNPSGDVYSGLYLSAPNRSALHTQALLLERRSPIVAAAREMMHRNESVGDVLGTMEDMDGGDVTLSVGSFPTAELRQYGMADFVTNGGYTGRSLETAYRLAGMADGTEQIDIGPSSLAYDRYSYRAMGNEVALGTVDALQRGFLHGTAAGGGSHDDDEEEDEGDDRCALAARLMAAMDEVLRRDDLGDMRCVNDHGGITSTGAYLHVDDPDGRVLVHVNKAGDGSYEPIEELGREFRRWREGNGCGAVVDRHPAMMEEEEVSPGAMPSSERENVMDGAIAAADRGRPTDDAIPASEDDAGTTSRAGLFAMASFSAVIAVVSVSFWTVKSRRKPTAPLQAEEETCVL